MYAHADDIQSHDILLVLHPYARYARVSDWANELHPTEQGFNKIANVFLNAMRTRFPGRIQHRRCLSKLHSAIVIKLRPRLRSIALTGRIVVIRSPSKRTSSRRIGLVRMVTADL